MTKEIKYPSEHMRKNLHKMNIRRLSPTFSQRLMLEEKFIEWAKENNAKNCPMNVISWYHGVFQRLYREYIIAKIKNCKNPVIYAVYETTCGTKDLFDSSKARCSVCRFLMGELKIEEKELK